MYKNFKEYESYIKNKSVDELVDISTQIDREKYPDRYLLILRYLEKKKKGIYKKNNDGPSRDENVKEDVFSKVFANVLIPRYNEISLFLMSIAFVLLFFTNADLRIESHEFLFENFDPRSYIALAFFVIGILYSLFHVFTTLQKTDWEKTTMLFFAVMVNGLSGIAAGAKMLEDSHGLLVIFPIWNIINGLLLLIMFRFGIINENSIVDDNATPLQVLLGFIVVGVIFVICQFVYKMYWAFTFSICVAYASNINETALKLFYEFQDILRQNDKATTIN